MDKHDKSARKMAKLAEEATRVMFDAMRNHIGASGYEERHKIGAAIVAISEMYGSLLCKVLAEGGSEAEQMLAMGSLQNFVIGPMKELMEKTGGGAIVFVEKMD